jgi:isocitrate/isopropylmalate dehydrogenase
MMMDYLGEADVSSDIETAIRQVLQEGKVKTQDMGGVNSTSEMGDAIRKAIF